MKRILGALVLASFAPALPAADDAVNRKTWAASPEAYFTSEERTAWKRVGTDQEAREFVARSLADRGTEFEPMLRGRIAVADKYFSSGKEAGVRDPAREGHHPVRSPLRGWARKMDARTWDR
ncbi:MAG: hypothetical protein LC796_08995 [Acidobacteria bacterium]|nr:hypothetical protein [Acidobacteriota bacterium]MCA1612011.1 hypothetical protein [Acidobacteriota bacterium]